MRTVTGNQEFSLLNRTAKGILQFLSSILISADSSLGKRLTNLSQKAFNLDAEVILQVDT